jgi:hypothetical protein
MGVFQGGLGRIQFRRRLGNPRPLFRILDAGYHRACLDVVVHVEEDLLDLTLGLGGDRGLLDGFDHAIELVFTGDGPVSDRRAVQLGDVEVRRPGGRQGGQEGDQGGHAHEKSPSEGKCGGRG